MTSPSRYLTAFLGGGGIINNVILLMSDKVNEP